MLFEILKLNWGWGYVIQFWNKANQWLCKVANLLVWIQWAQWFQSKRCSNYFFVKISLINIFFSKTCFGGVRVIHLFSCVFVFCLSSSCVLCAWCCHCLWIVFILCLVLPLSMDCLHPVSCVPGVATVYGLSIHDCCFGFF